MSNVKIIVIAVFVIGVLGSVVGLSSWANQPSKNDKPSSGVVQGASTTVGTKQLNTSYFSTTINSDMAIKTQDQAPHGDKVFQALFSNSKSNLVAANSDQIAITIGIDKNSSVKDLTDVQFRLQRNGIYLLGAFANAPDQSYHFVKTVDGYETSIFWEHGNYYAEVVISGQSNRIPQLEYQLQLLMQNWSWSVE